jgi:hypothetical protein
MLLSSKRPTPSSLPDDTPEPKTKRQRQKSSQDTGEGTVALLASAVATLDDSRIYRPAAHLAKSDVTFLSHDNKTGFALHSFLLKMRSPVFASMIGETHDVDLPIVLAEPSADLKLFFQALYSNCPHVLFKSGEATCALARLSHKYAATELEQLCAAHLARLAKKTAFVDRTPSVGALLLVAQQTRNENLTNAILTRSMAKLCGWTATVQPGARTTCALHYQPLPCLYKLPSCTKLPVTIGLQLDAAAKSTLILLNPKTLVALIEKLAQCVGRKAGTVY